MDNSDLCAGYTKPLETGIGTGIRRTKRKDRIMHNGVGSIKEESGTGPYSKRRRQGSKLDQAAQRHQQPGCNPLHPMVNLPIRLELRESIT